MKSGELDRRVTLLIKSDGATNGLGEVAGFWADGPTLWAKKLNVSDAERVNARAVGVAITVRLVVRWSRTTAALTTADRLRFEGAVYEISGIKEIGRRDGLELTAARIDEAKT